MVTMTPNYFVIHMFCSVSSNYVAKIMKICHSDKFKELFSKNSFDLTTILISHPGNKVTSKFIFLKNLIER